MQKRATKKPRQPNQSSSPDDISKCSSTDCKQEMRILDFPRDIISLILIRLPVNTLSILKCVNTHFSGFISSPEFVRAHLKFSTEDTSMSGYSVTVNSFGSSSNLRRISIQSLVETSQPSRTLVDFDYAMKELRKGGELLGSCNGIVFVIVEGKDLFLWNPDTGKRKELPNIECSKNLSCLGVEKGKCVHSQYGFGFDESSNDYKVVALVEYKCPDLKSSKEVCYVVIVYSLRRGFWIRFPDITGGQIVDYFGTFASGKLHWRTDSGVIVSFDVEKEVFGTLEQPNHPKSDYHASLSVLGGSISVSYMYSGHVDVWVMKESGVQNSWTKMFTLPAYRLPLSILPNGEVLLGIRNCLDIYNPKDNKVRFTGIHYYHDPVIYVGSLVSPLRV